MKHYELMFVVEPASDEAVEEIRQKVEAAITGSEGAVMGVEKLGKRRLAYPIKKHQYGVYYLVNFQSGGRAVQAVDYFLRLNTGVLRHIILNFSEKHLAMRDETARVQEEEAERMRRGGRPMGTEGEPGEAKNVSGDSKSGDEGGDIKTASTKSETEAEPAADGETQESPTEESTPEGGSEGGDKEPEGGSDESKTAE